MKRLLLCILLLLTIVPAARGDSPRDELKGVRQEIKAKKQLITKTRKVEAVVSTELVEINRTLTRKENELGKLDRDLANVESSLARTGREIARVTDEVAPGVLYMAMHYGNCAVNRLTNTALDPMSKMPELKHCAVAVEKIKA